MPGELLEEEREEQGDDPEVHPLMRSLEEHQPGEKAECRWHRGAAEQSDCVVGGPSRSGENESTRVASESEESGVPERQQSGVSPQQIQPERRQPEQDEA